MNAQAQCTPITVTVFCNDRPGGSRCRVTFAHRDDAHPLVEREVLSHTAGHERGRNYWRRVPTHSSLRVDAAAKARAVLAKVQGGAP